VSPPDLPRDVFKHYFFHYLYTNSLVMLHAVVTIMLRFPEVMQTADYRKLIAQLFRLVDEPLLCVLRTPLFLRTRTCSRHDTPPRTHTTHDTHDRTHTQVD
jgi:hypothetical protein